MDIQIRVDRTGPPEGSIAVADAPARPFAGWLELFAALEEVLSPAPAPDGRNDER